MQPNVMILQRTYKYLNLVSHRLISVLREVHLVVLIVSLIKCLVKVRLKDTFSKCFGHFCIFSLFKSVVKFCRKNKVYKRDKV